MRPIVQPFFDPATVTVTYVVSRSGYQECAIIDAVLDYDPKAGRTSTTSADKVIEFIRQHGLRGPMDSGNPRARGPPVGGALLTR